MLLQALEIRQEIFGSKHPDVADSMNNLAELYKAQERYAEAEPLLLQALEIRQEVLGDKHPDVAFIAFIIKMRYNSDVSSSNPGKP